MSNPTMTFGAVRFTPDLGPNRCTRSKSWNYSEIPRMGYKPTLQATDSGLVKTTVSGVIVRDQLDTKRGETVRSELDKLWTIAEKREANALAFGDGEIIGLFVIASISEDFGSVYNGQLIEANFTMELLEFAP